MKIRSDRATGRKRQSAPTDPRAAAARVLARLKEIGQPVSVDAIVRSLGARLSFDPFAESDISGFVARRPGMPPVIGVNSAHPMTRQRFTIAHEIGHLVMHDGQPLIVDKLVRVNLRRAALPSTTVEIQANQFAAALLMPETLLRREFERLAAKRQPMRVDNLVDDLIDSLARSFAVSAQAMRIRLNELDLLSMMVLY
jgi:Zn-dependent peptidase ImmA (M78 family)